MSDSRGCFGIHFKGTGREGGEIGNGGGRGFQCNFIILASC